MSNSLQYGIVTPARNEAINLPRLAHSLAQQSSAPTRWMIVETGSTDETQRVATELASVHPWIRLLSVVEVPGLVRGGPVARGFESGFAALDAQLDVVVKVDADVSFQPDYFARLLERFADDPSLGIASGTCFEQTRGAWRERHVTGTTVWGAARAYRSSCLLEILPLEQRMGWDGVDEFRANVRGWQTKTFRDIPFRHHRREGERDGTRWRARVAQGTAAHYLGYRLSYLTLRTLWHARKEPAALGMLGGYLQAKMRRSPTIGDSQARAYLRRQQTLGRLPIRVREALGRRS